jgi:hypothetical protein
MEAEMAGITKELGPGDYLQILRIFRMSPLNSSPQQAIPFRFLPDFIHYLKCEGIVSQKMDMSGLNETLVRKKYESWLISKTEGYAKPTEPIQS